MLDLPTIGVTNRLLLAAGDWPADEAGASSPLVLEDEVVGAWVRTWAGTRPLAAHAAWRTDPETATTCPCAEPRAYAGAAAPGTARGTQRTCLFRHFLEASKF